MAAKGSAPAAVRRTYDLAAEAHHAKLLDPSDSAWNVSERYAMLESLGDLSGKSVLDVGCGSGVVTAGLFEHGAASVAGVDFSLGQIRIAARENPGAFFAVGDAAALPLPDEAFDVAAGSYLIHYFTPETLARHFAEVGRVLRPGGRYHFSTDHPAFVDYLLGGNGRRRTYDWEMMSKGRVLFKMTSYRHPLEEVMEAAGNGGLRVEKILVPKPPEFMKELSPGFFEFATGIPTMYIGVAVKS